VCAVSAIFGPDPQISQSSFKKMEKYCFFLPFVVLFFHLEEFMEQRRGFAHLDL